MEIWLGEAGSGKTSAVCKTVAAAQVNAPDGAPIYVVTPDQATFFVEKKLLDTVPTGVLTRAQVHHFRRLASRTLAASGEWPRESISPAGKYAIFSSVYQEQRANLKVYGKSGDELGLTDRLLRLVEELQDNSLPSDWETALARGTVSLGLRTKMEDLLVLWKAYDAAIAGRFIDPYHFLPTFVEWLHLHPERVAKWQVYVDGFLGLTGNEWKVLEALAETVATLVVTIGLPPDFADKSDDDIARAIEFTPFAQAADVLKSLREFAVRKSMPLHISAAPDWVRGARFHVPSLAHLECHMFAASFAPIDVAMDGATPGLRMAYATGMDDEIAGVLSDIDRQRRTGELRYRDFTLIVTDWNAYRHPLLRALRQENIPFTVDERRRLADHPLPRLIMALLGVASGIEDEETELIKSDLLGVTRQEADRVENILLERGVRLREWLANAESSAADMASVRQRLRDTLAPLLRIDQGVRTATVWMRRLWEVLDAIRVGATLFAWENAQVSGGVFSHWHRQAYEATLRILDDVATAVNERLLTSKSLYELLDHAFQGATLGSIPEQMDAVLVTDVGRVRAFESQVVYVLGCQEGLLPKRVTPDELIGDTERGELLAQGVRLAAESAVRQRYERYRVYMAMTRAKRQLVLSYALQDGNGRARLPALLLRKWQRSVQGLALEMWDSEALPGDQQALSAYRRADLAAANLGQLLHTALVEGNSLPPIGMAAYQLFAGNKPLQAVALPFLIGLRHGVFSERLPRHASQVLFGAQIPSSVSRLERYAACPFAHFVDYGLRATERKRVRWDARNQGNLLHKALYTAQMRLIEGNTEWDSLSDDEVQVVAKAALLAETDAFAGGKLHSGGRNRLLYSQLERTLIRALQTLTEHARRGAFHPLKLEHPYFYADPAGAFTLKGRIDRIDVAALDGATWFRVIDFKSGNRSVNLAKVYHGLSLQLLLYAAACEDEPRTALGKEAQFAGMFYFPVHDPIKSREVIDDSKAATVTMRQEARMDGLVFAAASVVDLLDAQAKRGAVDLFRKILNQNGSYSHNAVVADANEWAALKALGYAHATAFTTAAAEGDTRVAPYKMGKESPCTYCAHAAICAFEPVYHSDRYRRLPTLGREEVMEKLAESRSLNFSND